MDDGRRMDGCGLTDLHEARDGLHCLVRLVEDVPPGEGGASGPTVLRRLGQEVGDVGHPPLRPAELPVEEGGAGVVLEQSLQEVKEKKEETVQEAKPQRVSLFGKCVDWLKNSVAPQASVLLLWSLCAML